MRSPAARPVPVWPGTEARRGYIRGGEDLREQIGGELRATAAAHQPACDETLVPAVEDGERLLPRVAGRKQLSIGGVLPSSRHRNLSSASVAVCDRDLSLRRDALSVTLRAYALNVGQSIGLECGVQPLNRCGRLRVQVQIPSS